MALSHECDSSQGATVEEVVIEVNKTKAALDSVEKDFKQMVHLNRVCSSLR
jgi:hypothetical protein